MNVEQLKVETGEDANSAELAAAKMQEQVQQAEIQVTRLRENLALIAGVSVDDVTLGAKNWTVKLQLPAIALPDLMIADGAVAPASSRNLDLIVWASDRIGLPLGMTGPPRTGPWQGML
ncbi:MAG: hypothetical protein KBT59_10020 [Sphingomonadales bacterium]|nr:hypothetical protein [Sphingomonadales bacterium]